MCVSSKSLQTQEYLELRIYARRLEAVPKGAQNEGLAKFRATERVSEFHFFD